MKLSELIGKEIVNLNDGARFGTVGNSDLLIDSPTGNIESIIIPQRGGVLGSWFGKQEMVIPWHSIIRVGAEVIIVDIDDFRSILSK